MMMMVVVVMMRMWSLWGFRSRWDFRRRYDFRSCCWSFCSRRRRRRIQYTWNHRIRELRIPEMMTMMRVNINMSPVMMMLMVMMMSVRSTVCGRCDLDLVNVRVTVAG